MIAVGEGNKNDSLPPTAFFAYINIGNQIVLRLAKGKRSWH